jgi:NAD(P)-dependent dehydrogenase (short-subunit alcohol dehydrogenase family)
VDTAYRRWGRLDVLFNNAGVIQGKPLLDLTEGDWDRLMSVNLRAVFFVLQAAARRMLRQDPIPGSELRGKLIQTASIAAYRGGLPLTAHYAASKAGVVSITRTAAQALAASKITSNCICPGVVDTPMWAKLDADWAALEGWHSARPPRAAGRRRGAGGLPGGGRLGLPDGPGHQHRRRPRHGIVVPGR